ncbi:hypothetical protein N0V90_008087 [Kalmusia sp. IMI 367209]|nr:hypothetical protein N0V90_008087 [Kalmusia sp. IMI 367209]
MSTTVAANGRTQPWSGPGIMQSFVKLREDSQLSIETLQNWFDEVYLPAVLATGIVKSATHWKAASPNYGKQWMIVYEVEDLALVQNNDNHVGGSLKDIPRTSETFPTEGLVDDFIDFESRILSQIQLFGSGEHPADEVTTIIYAAMQPAPDGQKDLDAWYREEHNQQMSEQPGWKRTTRYSPLFQTRNVGKPGGLDFVALHQFGEGNKLGKEVEPLDPMTDWTKKCMSECTSIDAAVYHKVKTLSA